MRYKFTREDCKKGAKVLRENIITKFREERSYCVPENVLDSFAIYCYYQSIGRLGYAATAKKLLKQGYLSTDIKTIMRKIMGV